MVTKRCIRKVPALLFLLVSSYFFLRSYVYKAPQHIEFSSLQLHTLSGDPIAASTFSGRPVVLNFWAPWCSPCRTEMPWLDDLQRKHPDATVIGLEDDSDAIEQALSLQDAKHFSYMLAASNYSTREAFGHVAGLPTTLYISRSGRVIHTVTGIVPESVMERFLSDTTKRD